MPIQTYTIKRNNETIFVTSDQMNLTNEQALNLLVEYEDRQKKMADEMKRSFAAMSNYFANMWQRFGNMFSYWF